MPGDFDESSHPRAEDGKFGAGSGGAKTKATQDPKAKPSAKAKAAAAKTKVDDRRKAAKVKAQVVVAKAKERAKTLVAKAKAMKPRGKTPSKDAKAKVATARAAAKAKAKDIVTKAKARAEQIKTKAGVSSAKPKAGDAAHPTDAPPAKAGPVSAGSFKQHQASFEQRVTGDERQAALIYSGHQFQEINASLRGVEHKGQQTIKADRIAAVVGHLDAALAKVRIQDPVVTYRGAAGRPDVMAMKPGDVIHDKAYVSTSIDKNVAHEFASNADNGVVFSITSPAGTKIGAIPSQFSSEKEMLLGRGVAMRLDRHEITTHDGEQVHVMHMTVVGQT